MGGEPDPSSPGGRDASMERLRAQQLLVALRAADGPKRGHFVRVRPDAYVNVAPLAPAAELSGRIAVGDVLATADGRDITQCSRREAVDVITSTRPITIGFRVGEV